MSAFLKIFSIVRSSDYTISTWLLLGASIQCLLFASLPLNISLFPPIAFLTYRILRGYLIATGRLSNPLYDGVTHGRQTWRMPPSDGSSASTESEESIVVLVLAASWAHPNGNFSPGSAVIGQYFQSMWADAEANREKYGFLGNTPGMVTQDSGERLDERGNTTVFLSYWKSLEGLHKFAHAEPHMKGQLWWERGAMEKFPYIGVMHETYEVPKGNWENVFHNFRPFGISNAQYPVKSTNTADSLEEKKTVEWVSGLKSADAREWKTMYGRMGRKAGIRNSTRI
ncbi:hypothetical protein BKA66DRAFT_468226 [Pyrenochaeta sp. MPI-SDFR-AT-0127]|nr:hypothetical protein BKA66DRAFT_468226 [Pyrenochaeta sp. MPI-SDFR-AT-0127]